MATHRVALKGRVLLGILFIVVCATTFNLTRGLAVCLLFGGGYLVTVSKSRAELERDAQAMVREEAGDRE